MGIEAIYRKPHLSKPHPGHTVYPYLLRNLDITEANSVWCSHITYIPMARGFCYLVAIMDWANRKVLSWRLWNTLDTSFCVETLEEALQKYGTPDIFNTDQGSQLPPQSLRISSHAMASQSAWTAMADGGTTFLSNVSGTV
jgi:putative transposase